MPNLSIENWPYRVPLSAGTVLDAGLEAGVPIPNQCRSGECGSCKCQLLSGEVQHLPHIAGTLSAEQSADGWILACRSKAKGPISVRFPEPLSSPVVASARHTAEVIAVTRETRDVVELRLRPLAPLGFHPGQYFDLTLPGKPARSYSPATLPDRGELAFYVKVLPDGHVSPMIAEGLSAGTQVRLNGPFGSSCLSDAPDGPVLLLGGGTGIAPLISIAQHLAETSPHIPCRMYFGVRKSNDVFAESVLSALSESSDNFELSIILSEPDDKTTYRTGLIGPALGRDCACLSEHRIFIAGPPAMVECCQRDVLNLRAAPEQVSIDSFLPSNSYTVPTAQSGIMRLGQRLFGSTSR